MQEIANTKTGFWQKFFYALFVLLLILLGAKLFFEQELSVLWQKFGNNQQEQNAQFRDSFSIIYPDVPQKLEVTFNDPATRQRLVNSFEALVKTDKDLNVRPALALNWGLIDDYTWEFRLRPNVMFHDGSSFDADDVVASFARAKNYEQSALMDLLENVESVEKIDDLKVRIKTIEPDPLLLQKVSQVLVFAGNDAEDKDLEDEDFVGTGPYKFNSWDLETRTLVVEKFDDYWGNKAKFGSVTLYTIPDKFTRVNALLEGNVDFLSFVPYDAVETLEQNGLGIATLPSLEVQFLLFNMDSKVLDSLKKRELVSLAIDQSHLINLVGGFAEEVDQFVSTGVFGFNAAIQDHQYDIDRALELAKELGLQDKTLQFHLTQGLTVLGDYLREQMNDLGINLVVSYLDVPSFFESMENKKADIYFLAFKSDLGDALDFLQTIVYSRGDFSKMGYENLYVDKLIESSITEMDVSLRGKNLREAMKVAVEEDVIGVPLFEYETVYGYNPQFSFSPRIDGLIYFSDIKINK